MPYFARPNSFIRLKISAVTSEKVRVLDIPMAPTLGPSAAPRVTALEIIEKPANRAHRGGSSPA